MTRTLTIATLLAAVACSGDARTLPPEGQILLFVDTDAPLPAPAGESLSPGDPTPLFDRVRIDVVRPGESTPCAGCTHEFDLDRKLVAEGRASVGFVTPPRVGGHRARVRLFRAAVVELGEPRPDATVETTIVLPPAEDEGITPVTVTLRTDAVARPVGSLDHPADPQPGRPTPIGVWPSAHRVACAGEPSPGEVCVPGGAFWMGHPRLRTYQEPGDDLVMRIAVLSPFFLRSTEVTVAAFREARIASPGDPMRYSAQDGQPGPPLHCSYTDARGNAESLPVNCISWSKAREYCHALGGDLPTEAQYQYAASALESRLFPWGEDDPKCPDAVYARSRVTENPDRVCPGAWVMPAGTGERDRVAISGGVVFDLAGNVAEHVLDLWNLQTESCWGTGVFHDPLCTEPSADPRANGQHTIVGGSFLDRASDLAAGRRRPAFPFSRAKGKPAGGDDSPYVTSVGFRCARVASE